MLNKIKENKSVLEILEYCKFNEVSDDILSGMISEIVTDLGNDTNYDDSLDLDVSDIGTREVSVKGNLDLQYFNGLGLVYIINGVESLNSLLYRMLFKLGVDIKNNNNICTIKLQMSNSLSCGTFRGRFLIPFNGKISPVINLGDYRKLSDIFNYGDNTRISVEIEDTNYKRLNVY